MPVKKVTSVIFGGPNLDILYVTSMAKPPLAALPGDGVLRGSLFAIHGLASKAYRSRASAPDAWQGHDAALFSPQQDPSWRTPRPTSQRGERSTPYASKSSPPITAQSLRDRLGALRNLWPFFMQVWATSPALTATAIVLRLARALLPVATLYVGKLIIDEALRLVGLSHHYATIQEWFASGELNTSFCSSLLELTLAIAADVFGRIVALVNSLLSDRFNAEASVRLMQHAATLDLEDFEDSELQDRLDRARRLTMGRMTLLSQMFGQAQDVITVLSFAAGLWLFAPWLILLLRSPWCRLSSAKRISMR